MVVLPRSNPVYENISSEKINLPDALKRMGDGGFTGYLGFASPVAEAFILYVKGAMISILLLEGDREKTGIDAINALYDNMIRIGGCFSIYRMTPEIVMCAHALLHGDLVLHKQEVKSVDLKSVLARMKVQMLNGTVFFSTDSRSAMIFFREGNPIGFYNDAARDIEASPAESQKVAALPGATVQIKSTKPVDILALHNLLETINISKLWDAAVARKSTPPPQPPTPVSTEPVPAKTEPEKTPEPPFPQESQQLSTDHIEDLCEIASAYLGRQGSRLIISLIEESGGSGLFFSQERFTAFLNTLAERSSDIDPEAKIAEMIDLIRSEIAGRLSL